jgi:hypothetical protein
MSIVTIEELDLLAKHIHHIDLYFIQTFSIYYFSSRLILVKDLRLIASGSVKEINKEFMDSQFSSQRLKRENTCAGWYPLLTGSFNTRVYAETAKLLRIIVLDSPHFICLKPISHPQYDSPSCQDVFFQSYMA